MDLIRDSSGLYLDEKEQGRDCVGPKLGRQQCFSKEHCSNFFRDSSES